MTEITCKIEFFSDWHTGSGLSAGADLDLLVIKDKNGLPFIPGKTLKGLLRDAALTINELQPFNDDFITEVFGKEAEDGKGIPSEPGNASFSNGELTQTLQENIKNSNSSKLLFRKISSTAIEKKGQAQEHSLRRMEVTIPLTLFAKIDLHSENKYEDDLLSCMKLIKRLGSGRNRGLGRCKISVVGGEK